MFHWDSNRNLGFREKQVNYSHTDGICNRLNQFDRLSDGKPFRIRNVGIIADFLTRSTVKILANSPWVLHFNSGSCNGCDIEIIAALTPRYDVERFGIVLQGSPRHADVLLATGPVTRQAEPHLRETYEQMPWPKFVFAIGQCAISGAIYEQAYNHCGGIDKAIPVSCYIPGCPPRPEEIVHGFCKLFTHLQEVAAKQKNPSEETVLNRKKLYHLLRLLRRR